MFTADREGNDSSNASLRPLGAPTAPNSRVHSPSRSNRNEIQPSSKEDEDADLQQAMAESMQFAPFQQEGGVIQGDGTEKKFGPATKEHYEHSQWALVPRVSATGEIIPEVDVEQRKNVPGEPRLLKHLADGDYLANFLTICHAIAGAREAMLMRQAMELNYGVDGDWWRGHAISVPRIVHTEDGRPLEPEADKYDELLAEVQRLMAFLDASDRSYATPGALMQVAALKDESPAVTKSKTLLEHFIQQWIVAATNKSGAQGDMSGLFNTHTAARSSTEDTDHLLFDLKADVAEGEKSDLAELMDGMLWGADTDDMDTVNGYVESPAEVLVMRLCHANPAAAKLEVEVPAEFYMDKYLKDNVSVTMGVRQQVAKGKTRIRKMTEIEKKLTTWKHPKKNEQLDAKVLLKHTHGHFSGQNRRDAAKSNLANGVTSEESEPDPPHYQEIAQQLDQVIASIDNKLTLLASEKEKTRKAISDMLRNPLPELEGQLKHRYTLRGVATKPNITYVLHPKEEDDDEEMLLGDVEDDGTPEGMQWWRIEYEVSGSNAKIHKTKTPDYDVLRAVELEHKEALLVYASDKVNDIALHNPILPRQLQEFVGRDNALFKTELQTAAKNAQPPAYDFSTADIPRQSIEPRNSMDSLRAEGGNDRDFEIGDAGRMSPPDYTHDDFMGHPDFGLPPGKHGEYEAVDDDEPVHEIKLDSPPAENEGMGTEMIEKVRHEPLVSGLSQSGDATMEDVDGSQDQGVGGNGGAQ